MAMLYVNVWTDAKEVALGPMEQSLSATIGPGSTLSGALSLIHGLSASFVGTGILSAVLAFIRGPNKSKALLLTVGRLLGR